MTLTPHLRVTPDADGVRLELKAAWLVLPAEMARELAQQLLDAAAAHDPLGVRALPEVKPLGDPIG